MSKEVKVTADLSLIIYDDTLEIWSTEEGRAVGAYKTELPALLAALETAAEGMGVETEKAELVKACKALLEAFEGYEMLAALPIDVAEKARAAIAKAEQ